MAEDDLNSVEQYHFLMFGAITHYYAKAEVGLKIVMAGLMGADLVTVMALTEPYSSLDLRNVLKSLNKAGAFPHELSPEERNRLTHLIGTLQSFGKLRNNIAHNIWRDGDKPDSIKPVYIDIRSGKVKEVGADPEEKSYTRDDLLNETMRIEQLVSDITQFLEDTGLQAHIDANIEQTKSATISGDGISNNDSK